MLIGRYRTTGFADSGETDYSTMTIMITKTTIIDNREVPYS